MMEAYSRVGHRADREVTFVDMPDGIKDAHTRTRGLYLGDSKSCRAGSIGIPKKIGTQLSGDLKRASSDSVWNSAGPEQQMEKSRRMPENARTERYKTSTSAQTHQDDDASCDSSNEPVVCRVAGQSWAGKKNGMKKPNQDVFCYLRCPDNRDMLFGVFDGHGPNGQQAAQYVKDHLPQYLLKHKELHSHPETAFDQAFSAVDEALEPAVNCSVSGTTAVLAQINGTHLIVAWVGDSKAVLGRRTCTGSHEAVALTTDHKPDEAQEHQRIVENNGRVERMTDIGGKEVGPYRVWLGEAQLLGLAMSRSLGDTLAHSIGVSPKPEVRIHPLDSSDDFLILASDGVWEFISIEEAVDIVGSSQSPESGCKHLMQKARSKWRHKEKGAYVDDITAMVIAFSHNDSTPFKRVQPEAEGTSSPSESGSVLTSVSDSPPLTTRVRQSCSS